MDTVWPQSSVYLFPSQTRSSVKQPSEVSCPGDRHGADFKELLNHRQDDCCVARLTLGAVVDTGEFYEGLKDFKARVVRKSGRE